MTAVLPAPVIVRPGQLPEIVGLSPATINRLRVQGDFPKPRKLGLQAIGFLRSEIDAWLDARATLHHFAVSL